MVLNPLSGQYRECGVIVTHLFWEQKSQCKSDIFDQLIIIKIRVVLRIKEKTTLIDNVIYPKLRNVCELVWRGDNTIPLSRIKSDTAVCQSWF